MIDPNDTTPLNPWQIAAMATYADGAYADVRTMGEVADVFDTILHGLMVELSLKEGCHSPDEAIRRLDAVFDDLNAMRSAILDLDEAHGCGVISVTRDTPAGIQEIGRAMTMKDAEALLAARAEPMALEGGEYSLDAPWGLATDAEAYQAAIKRGYQIFRSMGGLYYAAPGVSTDHRSKPGRKGWVPVHHDDDAAAAWLILSQIEP